MRLVIAWAMVVIPTSILAYLSFATHRFYGTNHRPGHAALTYLLVVIGVAAGLWAVEATVGIVRTRGFKTRDLRPSMLASIRTASWNLWLLRAAIAALISFAGAMGFGALALGLQNTVAIFRDATAIKARAADLWGENFDLLDQSQFYVRHGFGLDLYGYDINPLGWPDGNLFEDYGWPARCVRTLITPGLPRPGLQRWAGELPDQLSNIRILPVGLAVNTACMAAFLWAVPAAIRRIGSAYRMAQGRCVKCGYLLKGLERCPECGHAAGRPRPTQDSLA